LVAAEIMAENGFKDVKSLDGGSDGWFKKGFETTGKQPEAVSCKLKFSFSGQHSANRRQDANRCGWG
jgi:hypothetical protein